MIPKKLVDEIRRWMTDRKYGNIQINFADGKIVNINVVQSIKVEMLGTNTDSTCQVSATAYLASEV